MAFVPSIYQEAIFNWAKNPDTPTMVSAVAGSGKTTSLVKALSQVPEKYRKILFAAFNKAIADELKKRLPEHVDSRTIHSLGLRALNVAFPDIRRWDMENGKNKYRYMVRTYQVPNVSREEQNQYQDALLRLLDFAQLTLTPLEVPELMEMADRFNIEIPPGFDLQQAAEAVASMLEEGRRQTEQGVISYSDMIYMPLAMNLKLPTYDLLAIDEAQDLNKSQMTLLSNSVAPGGKIIAVGDRCQPPGTKVLRITKPGNRWQAAETDSVNIEDLNVGDQIATANLKDSHFYSNGKVEGITRRAYVGEMVTVTMGELRSRYTMNHHCLTNFTGFRGKYALYLMQKGEQFRIGRSQFYDASFNTGPLGRMRNEGADALWILAFYETKEEAMLMEQAISGKFGLPQLMFNEENCQVKGILDKAWKIIGNNHHRGVNCLEYFGRDHRYPLFTKSKAKQQSLKRPQIVHASNLMDGCLMLPYTGKAAFEARQWMPIKVTREFYDGDVYSLSVSGSKLYIADEIVTHNCQAIYMFAGAEADSFDQLKKHFGAGELPLNFCYRCPEAVIKEAQTIVPQIEAPPGTRAGVVGYVPELEFQKMLRRGDMVLSRTTAPLIKLCFELVAQRIPAKVKGREIGKAMAQTIKRIMRKETDVSRFPGIANEYLMAELYALRQKLGSEDKQEAVTDRVECLQICFTSFQPTTVDQFCWEVTKLFEDDGNSPITLCTTHRSKGLENPRVFIIAPEKMPLRWKNQSQAQLGQEMNLRYVAITRAQEELYFVISSKTDDY